jgi:hypothetical protein
MTVADLPLHVLRNNQKTVLGVCTLFCPTINKMVMFGPFVLVYLLCT